MGGSDFLDTGFFDANGSSNLERHPERGAPLAGTRGLAQLHKDSARVAFFFSRV